VWVQSGNKISFIATVTTSSDTFRVYYTKTICTQEDSDQDSIPDYLDICPNSISDTGINLKPEHYADIDSNGVFETANAGRKKQTITASQYTLQQTFGCTCKDILAETKYNYHDGQEKYGCTKGTIENWIDLTKSKDKKKHN
jgi:hypothetical protein